MDVSDNIHLKFGAVFDDDDDDDDNDGNNNTRNGIVNTFDRSNVGNNSNKSTSIVTANNNTNTINITVNVNNDDDDSVNILWIKAIDVNTIAISIRVGVIIIANFENGSIVNTITVLLLSPSLSLLILMLILKVGETGPILNAIVRKKKYTKPDTKTMPMFDTSASIPSINNSNANSNATNDKYASNDTKIIVTSTAIVSNPKVIIGVCTDKYLRYHYHHYHHHYYH